MEAKKSIIDKIIDAIPTPEADAAIAEVRLFEKITNALNELKIENEKLSKRVEYLEQCELRRRGFTEKRI